MILRASALIATLISVALLDHRTITPDDDLTRCGPPSPAESIVAERANAMRAAARASSANQPSVTAATLRARADTFARYASWRPDARPDSAALALAYEAQLYLALGIPDTA
ncbi:MAG: hypothetical protein ABI969_05515, partial [bacterium]